MKKSVYLFSAAVLFVASAHAQDRKIEEDWILADPTVAEEGKWKLGLSLDYTRGEYESHVSKKTSSRRGGSIIAGHANVTLMASYRSGDNFLEAGTNRQTGPSGETGRADVDFRQFEARLRYLLSDMDVLGGKPYLLAGYQYIDQTTKGNGDFTGIFTPDNSETAIHALSGGGGFIWPIAERVGIRADLSLGIAFGETNQDSSTVSHPEEEFSSTGIAWNATATAYWQIYGGFNIQGGIRSNHIALGNDDQLGDVHDLGGFVQIGYTHSF